MLVVLTTTPDFSEASSLAQKIVEAKLGACVQIVPQITSIYVWDGAIQKEDEQLLLIKTTEEKYFELERFISENHSYDVPEIVAIESAHVLKPYLDWLEQSVSK